MSCICGGGLLSRSLRKCPVCDKKARIITQHSFGGYVCTNFCGRCGEAWQDGELLKSNKEDKARHIRYVKENWKNANSTRIVLDVLMKEMKNQCGPGVKE